MTGAIRQALPQPRAAVRRMKEYHPPLGAREGLRFDFNENTLACSPRVLDVLGKVAAAELTKYPERAPVERFVAQHLGLDPEQVLLTNGVDEAIHVLCQTFLDGGDQMLLSVPTYAMYEVYASATGANVSMVQARNDFAFPLERMLDAITPATRLIAIANPNSPTGTVVAREQILQVAEAAPQAVVLVDEAYYHFYGQTVLDLIGRVPNLLVVRTFSKAYGLAGLRVGVLAAAAETQRWLRRVISPYSVNGLALACLPAAIADTAYLDWYVGEVKQARAEFVMAVTRLGIQHWPSEANFVLINIGALHRKFVQEMRERGVLTRDRSSDPGCDGCVRVTMGTLEQTRRAISALEETLAAIAWKRVE